LAVANGVKNAKVPKTRHFELGERARNDGEKVDKTALSTVKSSDLGTKYELKTQRVHERNARVGQNPTSTATRLRPYRATRDMKSWEQRERVVQAPKGNYTQHHVTMNEARRKLL
jgi:hypothetical protein